MTIAQVWVDNRAVMRARIIGTGKYLPTKVLTNSDIEKLVDTNDEWIFSRTGIRKRHIAADGEVTSHMATQAAKSALAMAGVAPEEVELILVGTITPDMPMPACAVYVQRELGAKNAFAFDISAACASSVYGLGIASQFIETGRVKRALVIGAEMLSRVTNWSDRGTCILFGDGAGAMVLAPTNEPNRGILSAHLHSDGNLAQLITIEGGGTKMPPSPEMIAGNHHKIFMNGRDVYKYAVRFLTDSMREALEKHNLTVKDLDHLIVHQANLRILEAVLERLEIPKEKAWLNIEHYGNTSSASLPISLDEANRAGALKPGQLIGMLALGAGIAWGSMLVRW